MTTREAKIAEGKTKIIWATDDPTKVLVESKDDITAGDGDKHDVLEGKAASSTTTTCNVFAYLNRHGVPTHFIEQVDERTFLAHRCQMFPIELVARRILTGSFLKRNPDAVEGTVVDELTFEIFEKDDANHDPFLEIRSDGTVWRRHADHPLTEDPIDQYPPEDAALWLPHLDELRRLTVVGFELIEAAWEGIEIDGEAVVPVDYKTEAGLTADGRIVIGDVIDNDSWRIWKSGLKVGQLDKQVYRETVGDMSPDKRRSIKKNYQLVAQATAGFSR